MDNKIKSLMILSVLVISFISAITIYSGEAIELELDKPYEYYSIVGNSSEVILEVIPHGNNVTVIINKYNLEDSFELVFFDVEKEVIHHYSSGGGGGTRTVYRDRNITQIRLVNQTILRDAEVIYGGEEIIEEIEGETLISIITLIVMVVLGIIALIFAILYPRRKEIPDSTYSDEKEVQENE